MKKTLKVTRLGWDELNTPHAREHVTREAWMDKASQEGKIIILDYVDGERVYY